MGWGRRGAGAHHLEARGRLQRVDRRGRLSGVILSIWRIESEQAKRRVGAQSRRRRAHYVGGLQGAWSDPRRRSLFLEPPLPRRARCPGWPRETAPPDCSISRAMCLAPALPVSECALCGVWLVCVRRDGGRGGRAQLGVEQRCAASPLLPDPPRGTVRAPLRHRCSRPLCWSTGLG